MKIFFQPFFFLILFTYSSLLFAEPKVIKIGASLPLSGPLAKIGEDIQRGLTLAKQDFDSENIKFDFVLEDDGFQGKNAASTGLKLLDIDKVDIIVSLWDMAEIIAPMAEKHKVPHISFRWNPHLAEQYKYTMTFEPTYISYADSWLAKLKSQNIKSVFILKEEIESFNLLNSYLVPLLQKNKIEVLGEISYLPGEINYQSILFKAIKKNPDTLLLFSMPESLTVIATKLRELFPDQNFDGSFDEFQGDPKLIAGLPYVSLKEISEEFNKRFEKLYGNKVLARAASAYDLINMINDFEASSKYNNSNKEELLDYLNSIKNYKGVAGNISSNGKGSLENACLWKVVSKEMGFKVVPFSPSD